MNKQMSSALATGDQTKVILKSNSDLGLDVRILENEDGSISINAEDTAIGFGWTKTEKKNGKEYTSVRWDRMNGFSKECGFAHEWSKDDYIPESLFYRLGMKASNERAQKFQGWLADDVIPVIRKTGRYLYNGLSTEMQALLMLDKRSLEQGKRITKLENTMTIDYGQQEDLRLQVAKRVIYLTGGTDTEAYKNFKVRDKVFREIYRHLKHGFSVNSYRNIAVKDYQRALAEVKNYVVSEELSLMIKGANSQMKLEP